MRFKDACASFVKKYLENSTTQQRLVTDVCDMIEVWTWLSKYMECQLYPDNELRDITSWKQVCSSLRQQEPWIDIYEKVANAYETNGHCKYQHVAWIAKQYKTWVKLNPLQQHLIHAQEGWKQLAVEYKASKLPETGLGGSFRNELKYKSTQLRKLHLFVKKTGRLPDIDAKDSVNERALARWVRKNMTSDIVQGVINKLCA